MQTSSSPTNAARPAAPRRRAPLLFALFLLAVLASLVAAGCASSTPAAGPLSPDGKSCGQRLIGGAWRFVGFAPDQALNPEAAQALERLHGSLRLQYDGKNALTTGPGLNHLGPYQIVDDDGLNCRLRAPDDNGVVTETSIRFLDANHVEITDKRSSVPGRSQMERVQAGM
jgi:hypothetical protein